MKQSAGALRRKSISGALATLIAVTAGCGGWAAWLRLTGNIHEVETGIVYRSGQLSAARMVKLLREKHINTVLNLRGENPGTAWYDAELNATRQTGVQYLSVPLSANREPDEATLAVLLTALRTAPTPLLIHCEAGADRSGLAAALYELAIMHRPAAIADAQLSLWFGHFPWLASRTGAMDRTFWRVAATPAPSKETSGDLGRL